jgi:hypothetical protein
VAILDLKDAEAKSAAKELVTNACGQDPCPSSAVLFLLFANDFKSTVI